MTLNANVLAQDLSGLMPLTPDNIAQIEQQMQLGVGSIDNLVWSPDGDTFVLSTERSGVFLYNNNDFTTPIDILPIDGATIFSPDGRFLASTSGDIWDFEENRLRGNFKPDGTYPYREAFPGGHIAFDPDSRYIFATYGQDILIWNVYGVGHQVPLEGDFSSVHVSPDGQYLVGHHVSYNESEYSIWSLPSRELVRQIRVDEHVFGSIISPDSENIVIFVEDGIKRFSIENVGENFEYPSVIQVASLYITMVTDGATLYILYGIPDGLAVSRVTLDDTGIPDEEELIYKQLGTPNWGLGPGFGTINLDPDGTYLAVSSVYQGFALISLEMNQREYHFLEYMEYVRSVQISPDNHYLAVGNGRANLHIWNLETESVEATLWGDVENTEGVIFEDDEFFLVQMDYDGQSIGLWNIREKRLLTRLQINPHKISTFTYNPQNQIAIAMTDVGIASLWQVDIENQSIVEVSQFDTGCSGNYSDTDISGDGIQLIVTSRELSNTCTVVFDINSQRQLEFTDSGGHIVAMNDDGGTWLYNSGDDVCVHHLELQEGVCVRSPFSWSDVVWDMAMNPDNELLAAILRFGDIYVADSHSGEVLAEIDGDGAAIQFNSDNRLLIAGTSMGYVYIYGVIND